MNTISWAPVMNPMAMGERIVPLSLVTSATALGVMSFRADLSSNETRAEKIEQFFKTLRISMYAVIGAYALKNVLDLSNSTLWSALQTKKGERSSPILASALRILFFMGGFAPTAISVLRVFLIAGPTELINIVLFDVNVQRKTQRVAIACAYYRAQKKVLKSSWLYSWYRYPNETALAENDLESDEHVIYLTDEELAVRLQTQILSISERVTRVYGAEYLSKIRRLIPENPLEATEKIAGLGISCQEINGCTDWIMVKHLLIRLGLKTEADLVRKNIVNPEGQVTQKAQALNRLQEVISESEPAHPAPVYPKWQATAERASCFTIDVLYGLGRMALLAIQAYMYPRIFTAGFVYGFLTAKTRFALSRISAIGNIQRILSLTPRYIPDSSILLCFITIFPSLHSLFNALYFESLFSPLPPLLSRSDPRTELLLNAKGNTLWLYESVAKPVESKLPDSDELASARSGYNTLASLLQRFIVASQEGEAAHSVF